jgi:c(7)-type cytochrome triheme protein
MFIAKRSKTLTKLRRSEILAVLFIVLALTTFVAFQRGAFSQNVLATIRKDSVEPQHAARPSIPGASNHLPCAGCHAQQFAGSSGPMCGICHTDSQSGKLKPFPRLASFNMKFDHGRHMRMGGLSCASCHRPARGGVAITIPAGFNAHTTCFRCHTPNAKSGEQNISSCGVCHQPGRHVRMRETATAFRVGFSHARHDQSEGLSCNECHRVRAGVARRLQVSAPQPLNHHASPGAFSCMSCHNGKKAFGGDDFTVCKRCHTGNAWRF